MVYTRMGSISVFCLSIFIPSSFAANCDGKYSDRRSSISLLSINSGDISTHWRLNKSCGVSCCYLLMRSFDFQIGLEAVQKVIPIGSRGSNLREMQLGCERLGFETEIVRGRSSDIDMELLPAIAHLEPELEVEGGNGHFVLIECVDQHFIYIVDPTHVTVQVVPRSDFLRAWSGLLLIKKRTASGIQLCAALVLSVQLTAIVVLFGSIYKSASV